MKSVALLIALLLMWPQTAGADPEVDGDNGSGNFFNSSGQ